MYIDNSTYISIRDDRRRSSLDCRIIPACLRAIISHSRLVMRHCYYYNNIVSHTAHAHGQLQFHNQILLMNIVVTVLKSESKEIKNLRIPMKVKLERLSLIETPYDVIVGS